MSQMYNFQFSIFNSHMPNIRWIQRFSHFDKALIQLEEAVVLQTERDLSNLEAQGLIQAFEFTHELAWNVMKDFFEYQGNTEIRGSRDATREAFQYGLIENGNVWMEMIRSRNQSSHTYNQDTAQDILEKVCEQYFSLFLAFREKMQTLI